MLCLGHYWFYIFNALLKNYYFFFIKIIIIIFLSPSILPLVFFLKMKIFHLNDTI
jgi:hypothetical protein